MVKVELGDLRRENVVYSSCHSSYSTKFPTPVDQKPQDNSVHYTFRDGPLEKLWRGRGMFEPQVFFFLVWIFFGSQHEYFLGLIGVHGFFSFNFPLHAGTDIFFVLRQPPSPLPRPPEVF